MEEKVKKQKFLQLQFCMLLVACTLLPDFGSLLGIPDFDIPVFCCKLIGIIGGGMALYAFYQAMESEIPKPFLALSGGGLLLALISFIPDTPIWLEYIALIALLIALFISKNSLKMQWNKSGSQGAYLVLIAILLHIYDGIGDTTMTAIAALIGLIIYFIGLSKLKEGIDTEGAKGISRLKIAVIVSIIAVIFGWIPLLGGIIAGILLLIAFIVEYMGYSAMKGSASLGAEGQAGAGKLCFSMIVMLIAAFINLFPLTGMFVGLITLVALWLVFQGWSMVLWGIESETTR
ncbi:hypothetical protein [uncultured Bacteroides sp.]|uniref:hypothetical protein n=1 Tax=uncultured Bacteroides sp. TaxID=162156 RepID=UPI00260A0D8D|nr:hypothetical protein [uncultured Bacteroides sp.]